MSTPILHDEPIRSYLHSFQPSLYLSQSILQCRLKAMRSTLVVLFCSFVRLLCSNNRAYKINMTLQTSFATRTVGKKSLLFEPLPLQETVIALLNILINSNRLRSAYRRSSQTRTQLLGKHLRRTFESSHHSTVKAQNKAHSKVHNRA